MPPFKSVKAPFHQPIIAVVLRALVERHPGFSNSSNPKMSGIVSTLSIFGAIKNLQDMGFMMTMP